MVDVHDLLDTKTGRLSFCQRVKGLSEAMRRFVGLNNFFGPQQVNKFIKIFVFFWFSATIWELRIKILSIKKL
jgi:hypothetical protein